MRTMDDFLPPSNLTFPDKKYLSIGEAAKFCKVKDHVLRYWEKEFGCLNPCKRKGNRRYYQKTDLEIILKIRELLQTKGFTIEGARHALEKPEEQHSSVEHNSSVPLKSPIVEIIKEVEEALEMSPPWEVDTSFENTHLSEAL